MSAWGIGANTGEGPPTTERPPAGGEPSVDGPIFGGPGVPGAPGSGAETTPGTGATPGGGSNGGGSAADRLNAFIQTVTEWIPADVLAIYLAGVTVLASGANASPNMAFLMVMAVVTPLAVLLGAFSVGKPIDGKVGIRAFLAFVAFLIWTLTVPFSGWQSIAAIAANSGIVAIASAIGGMLFALVAQGVSRRLDA